jgi:hypothetical protein
MTSPNRPGSPETTAGPKYPSLIFRRSELSRQMFTIVATIRRAMRAQGIPEPEIESFTSAIHDAPGYHQAFAVIRSWVVLLDE